ncbi:MAG: B12-binding domain-containing radical SAM protein [Bdellovibrionales bacterium]|nr:B12-binding domain-containing radical SAM protein [Bdellovibrionales bacterium]
MSDLDIIFLTLPRLELRSPITAPAILKAQVEEHGFKAKCIDLNLKLWHSLDSPKYGHMWFDTDLTFRHEDKFEKFWSDVLKAEAETWVKEIGELNPRWVGITVFSQRSKWVTIKLCELIRERLPNIKIVTGGAFSDRVSPMFKSRGLVDAYVVGEGELPIVEVLKGNLKADGINGVPAKQIDDLDTIPIPDYSDFDFTRYPQTWTDPRVKDPEKLGTQFVYITGSRGCVRKCDFCDVQSLWPKFRYRSGAKIAEEMMEQNTRYGSKRFLFTDSLLNGSVKQLKELCQTLIDYRDRGKMKPVRWQGQFIARPERFMKDEVYALMKEAGCFFVSIGVESGSELVRNDMKKMFDDKALDFTFNACAKYGIEMAWLLLVGYPTETEEEFQKTLDLLDKYQWINEKGLVRSVALGPTLDIVPGSPLYNRQKEMGITWDEHGNWVYKDNNRVTRIKRWLRLKDKCKELGYPIVEKATEHLLMELDNYQKTETSNPEMIYDHFNENFGSMDRQT